MCNLFPLKIDQNDKLPSKTGGYWGYGGQKYFIFML